MALRSKPPRFEPDEVVVCHSPFATATDIVVQGERRRGSDPTVREFPGNFIADGVPQSEWPNMWESMPEPAQDERVAHMAESKPLDAICILAFGSTARWVKVGERFALDDEVVCQHPEHFARLVPLQ